MFNLFNNIKININIIFAIIKISNTSQNFLIYKKHIIVQSKNKYIIFLKPII